MTGYELKQMILRKDKSVAEVAKMIGVTRAGLYGQIARTDPKKYYVLAVKKVLGVK